MIKDVSYYPRFTNDILGVVSLEVVLNLYSQSGKASYQRPRQVSKPRDSNLKGSNRSEICKHLGSSAAKIPVKFQSNTMIIKYKLTVSRLREIWQHEVLPLSE